MFPVYSIVVSSIDRSNQMAQQRDSSSTGIFIGIIVALALLAIAYLVFSANSQPNTKTAASGPPGTLTSTIK